MIHVQYLGRLGNNLFQYCLGRILAQELRWSLDAPPIPGFVNTGPRRRLLPTWTRRTQTLTGHQVDLPAVLADRRRRHICLDGFFQRYEYFREHKQAIRDDWLRSDATATVGERDLTIHLRSGDLWQAPDGPPPHPEYVALPFSFYRRIIEARDWERVHVVTDDASDPMVRRLVDVHGVEVRSGSVLEDFAFLRASRHVVLSVSSFSWWAAWLSRAAAVHFPVTGIWDPALRPDVDLRVLDEPRYTFHAVDSPQPWSGSPEDRARLLES